MNDYNSQRKNIVASDRLANRAWTWQTDEPGSSPNAIRALSLVDYFEQNNIKAEVTFASEFCGSEDVDDCITVTLGPLEFEIKPDSSFRKVKARFIK